MIDTPVLNIISFFNSTLASFTQIAWRLSWIIALAGILWASFQVTIGTSDVRKAYVGAIVKLFTFLLCMSLYPAFSSGLCRFASSLGWENSGDGTTQNITAALAQEAVALGKVAKKIDEASLKAEAVKNSVEPDWMESWGVLDSMYNWWADGKIKRLSKQAGNEDLKFAGMDTEAMKKRITAITKVVKADGGTGNLFLDLKMKDPNGKEMDYYSPDAIFNVTLLIGQIALETEMALDVEANADQKGIGGTYLDGAKTGNDVSEERDMLLARAMAGYSSVTLFNMPVLALGRMLLCVLAVIVMFVCQIACLIQYVMAILEYSISQAVCVILVPMTLMDELREYSHKIMGTLFAQAMKLCMITCVMVMDLHIFTNLLSSITSDGSGFGLIQFGQFCLTGLLTFSLCANGPKLAATICTGSPQMSMGEFMASAAAAAGAGAVVASQAKQAGRFAINRASDAKNVTGVARSAYAQARSSGASGGQALGHALGAGGKQAAHLAKYNAKEGIKAAMSQPGQSLLKGNAFQRGEKYNPGTSKKIGAWSGGGQTKGPQGGPPSGGTSAGRLSGGGSAAGLPPTPGGPVPSLPGGSGGSTALPPRNQGTLPPKPATPSLPPPHTSMAGSSGSGRLPKFNATLDRQQNANLYSDGLSYTII